MPIRLIKFVTVYKICYFVAVIRIFTNVIVLSAYGIQALLMKLILILL